MICFGFERKFLALYKKPVRSKVYLENRSRAVTHIPNELLRQTTIKSSSDVNRTRRVSTETHRAQIDDELTRGHFQQKQRTQAAKRRHLPASRCCCCCFFWCFLAVIACLLVFFRCCSCPQHRKWSFSRAEVMFGGSAVMCFICFYSVCLHNSTKRYT